MDSDDDEVAMVIRMITIMTTTNIMISWRYLSNQGYRHIIYYSSYV